MESPERKFIKLLAVVVLILGASGFVWAFKYKQADDLLADKAREDLVSFEHSGALMDFAIKDITNDIVDHASAEKLSNDYDHYLDLSWYHSDSVSGLRNVFTHDEYTAYIDAMIKLGDAVKDAKDPESAMKYARIHVVIISARKKLIEKYKKN